MKNEIPKRCPTCGHLLTKTKAKTKKATTASQTNGKKGGRPKKIN